MNPYFVFIYTFISLSLKNGKRIEITYRTKQPKRYKEFKR